MDQKAPVTSGVTESTWQPIETAPKAKQILVYAEGMGAIPATHRKNRNGTQGFYFGVSISMEGGPIRGEAVITLGYELPVPGATHWMPLPDPPR